MEIRLYRRRTTVCCSTTIITMFAQQLKLMSVVALCTGLYYSQKEKHGTYYDSN